MPEWNPPLLFKQWKIEGQCVDKQRGTLNEDRFVGPSCVDCWADKNFTENDLIASITAYEDAVVKPNMKMNKDGQSCEPSASQATNWTVLHSRMKRNSNRPLQ